MSGESVLELILANEGTERTSRLVAFAVKVKHTLGVQLDAGFRECFPSKYLAGQFYVDDPSMSPTFTITLRSLSCS